MCKTLFVVSKMISALAKIKNYRLSIYLALQYSQLCTLYTCVGSAHLSSVFKQILIELIKFGRQAHTYGHNYNVRKCPYEYAIAIQIFEKKLQISACVVNEAEYLRKRILRICFESSMIVTK